MSLTSTEKHNRKGRIIAGVVAAAGIPLLFTSSWFIAIGILMIVGAGIYTLISFTNVQ